MAEGCQCGLGEQSADIQQILFSKAQHRWLRPDEICEVLRNYEKFQISALSPNIPPSGSLFLFNRKVLKNFRKDGHKWRKKKDGKTLKESHETLQAGSINAMQCYYARGEENANFQRRIYWLLEEKLSHIVFVHYLEITGNRTNINRVRETEAAAPYSLGIGENITMSETESFVPSRFHSNNFAVPSATTVYNNGATPGFQSFVEQQPPIVEVTYTRSSAPILDSSGGKLDDNAGVSDESLTDLDFEYLQGAMGDWTTSTESGEFDALFFSSPSTIGEHLSGNCLQQQEFGGWQHMQEETQMHQNLQSSSLANWEIVVEPGNGTDVSSLPSEEEKNTSILGPSTMVQLFSIVDFSPGWAYAYTETKVLVTGIFLRSLIVIENCKWSCMFGEVEVPAEVITYGVLRCYTPIHEARCVPFYVTCSNGLACSEVKEFEFRNGHVECNGWASEIHSDTGCLRDESQFMNISSDFHGVTHIGDLHMQSSSRADWKTANNRKIIDVSSIPSKGKTGTFMLGPSLTQDQLFSIVDFSPNWAYVGSEIEVLITGTFLKGPDLIQNTKWSCMFGEVEVPLEVGADGVLCCHTPKHEAGRVPFYVTCSNRIACSEVREFEFRAIHSDDRNTADDYGATSQVLLLRFGKLLRLNSYVSDSGSSSFGEIPQLSCKINSLLMEGTSERDEITKLGAEERFYCPFKDCSAVMINENSDSGEVIRESECPCCHRLFCAQCKVPWHPGVDCEEFQRLNEDERGRDDLMVREVAKEKKWGRCPHCKFYVERTDGCPHMTCRCGFHKSEKLKEELEELDQKLLKEKLRMWLLQKVAEDGEGPSVLDEGGQGVLHFAAALGYVWAFEPTIVAGVDVNFRDVHGWTALHWAASRGRERSVASLLALGADPAAKTDPSPKYPLGRSSYQLASANGHKGVAGYLVEASITCLFESLSLDVQDEVNDFSEVQLFREKQLGRSGDDKFEISDEQALSLTAVKSYKTEQNHEPMHAAAIRIQNKFRSWKCRKLFLIIRKRIVKIQAHVRGHQVRKIYRTKVWSIGVVDIEVDRSEKGHQIHHPAAIDHSDAKHFSSLQQPRTRKKDDCPVKRTLRLPAPLMGNTVLPPDDCYTWRKYGQKDILGSRYPRSYYRCVHRHLYGCLAKKQVQCLDDDPGMFEVTYRGEHTCHMSATAPSNPPPSTQTQSMVDVAQSSLPSLTLDLFSPSSFFEDLEDVEALLEPRGGFATKAG